MKDITKYTFAQEAYPHFFIFFFTRQNQIQCLKVKFCNLLVMNMFNFPFGCNFLVNCWIIEQSFPKMILKRRYNFVFYQVFILMFTVHSYNVTMVFNLICVSDFSGV